MCGMTFRKSKKFCRKKCPFVVLYGEVSKNRSGKVVWGKNFGGISCWMGVKECLNSPDIMIVY